MPHSTLTLKQRLAALHHGSGSSSASVDQLGRADTVGPKWRTFLPRRNTESDLHSMMGQDRVQEVMGRLVFQAGVDFETRPMVVMSASALPDPQEVSYDLLLSRIVAYMDLYVESDYTVVFFAAGSRHTPSWNWVWKAYRSLARKYRKNLKRLIIVHPSFFTKMLFTLASAMISPKFFRKITYTPTLSALAAQVPITQIDIPPAVYQENLKHEGQIVMPTPHRADLFGVPLEDLMGYNGEKGSIPRVVRDCIQFLRSTGMEDQGLFRKSPSDAMLKSVVAAYDRGQVVSLDMFNDPHLAAVLIKRYLRELPEPVFPERTYSLIRRCPTPSSEPSDVTSILYIRDVLLADLPRCVYILLSHVLHLLHEISLRADVNLMDAFNLSRCVTPTLARSDNLAVDRKIWEAPGGQTRSELAAIEAVLPGAVEGGTSLGTIVAHCIERYFEIFDEVDDPTEVSGLPIANHNMPAVQIVRPQSPDGGSTDGLASVSASASASASASRHSPSGSVQSYPSFVDDESSIDDAMLVMPVGPSRPGPATAGAGTSSAWAGGAGPNAAKYRPARHRAGKSRDSKDLTVPPSSFGGAGAAAGPSSSARSAFGYATYVRPSARANAQKARSTISIEKGGPLGAAGMGAGRGSIAVGRGTTRKGSGSAVEAMGVTASGFFTAPGEPESRREGEGEGDESGPPVPPRP